MTEIQNSVVQIWQFGTLEFGICLVFVIWCLEFIQELLQGHTAKLPYLAPH